MGAEWTRFPIARLRYVKTSGVWSLFWRDRNLRFHAYDLAAPTASIEELLAELDRDPTAIFGADRLRLCRPYGYVGDQAGWSGPVKSLARPVVEFVSDPP